MKLKKQTISNLITYLMVIVAFVICQTMISSGSMSRSLRGQMVPITVYVVMAVSLNLVVGISGELSLGHAGFMSIGAFTGAITSAWLLGGMGMENTILRLIISMVFGGIVAGIFGVIISVPVLRLKGDYLAIVTLAFGEIIRNILNCLYISLDNGRLILGFNDPNVAGTMIVNGPQGAVGIQKIATFPMGFALILFTLFIVLNMIDSRTGRAIMALRDNRIAAESVGISVTSYKMMAFVTAAALAGMAGALFALNFSTVAASKFKFDTSILVLVFVVLGGIGNIRGSIIAAALLTVLPELLRAFNDYRMLIYAVVLILVMIMTNNERMVSVRKSIAARLFMKQKGGVER